MNWGRALRIARASARLKQIDIAKALDVSSACVSQLEANHRAPSLKYVELIAKMTNIPLYLLVLLASDKDTILGAADVVGPHLLTFLAKEELA